MTNETTDTTVASVAKDVAVGVAKEVALTVAGVVIATGLFAGATAIVSRVQSHRASQS